MSNKGDMAATIRLQKLTCVEPNEKNDQPYIWPIFAKLDDDALYYALKDETTIAKAFSTSLQGDALKTKLALDEIYKGVAPPASAWFYAPGGEHGNLQIGKGVAKGQVIDIPAPSNYFSFTLKRQLTADDAMIGAIAVIMEEDEYPDDKVKESYQYFFLLLFEALVVMLIEQAGNMYQTPAYLSQNPSLLDSNILTKSIPEIETALETAIQKTLIEQMNSLPWYKELPLDSDEFIGCKVAIRKALDLTTNSAPTFSKTFDENTGSQGGVYTLEGSAAGIAIPFYTDPRIAPIADAPTAFAVDGYQHIFYHDSNHHIHELWFDGSRKVWNQGDLTLSVLDPSEDLTERSKDTSLDAYVAPTSFWLASDSSQHVEFCVKETGSKQDGNAQLVITELRESGGKWAKNRMGTPVAPASSPKGFRRGSDYCVLYVGTDRHLHVMEYSTSKKTWADRDLTPNYKPLSTDEAFPGVPCGYPFSTSSLEVFYRDPRGAIKWIASPGVASWAQEIDLTAQTGAPPAISNGNAFFRDSDQSCYVVYGAADHCIHILTRVLGQQWKHIAPSTLLKCPLMSGNPYGFVWTYDNSIHIIHRGEGAHLYDLYSSGTWGIKDITVASSITLPSGAKLLNETAKSDPVAWSWKTDNGMHVVFTGFDDRLHEIVAVPGKEWRGYDLFHSLGI